MRKLPLFAAVVLVMSFLLIPIVMTIWSSLSTSDVFVFPPRGFTLDWYRNIPPSFIAGLQVSLIVALSTTLLAVMVGVPAALGIARGTFPGRGMISTLCLSPLMVPTLVIGVAAFQVSVHVFDMTGVATADTVIGIILAQSAFTIPYVIRGVLAGHANFDASVEEAASSLGSAPLQTFCRITLPALLPGVVSGAIFAFVMSLDDIPVSLFMGGADATTLPVRIFTSIQFSFNPDVMAVATILMVITLGLVLVLDRLIGLDKFFGLARD